MQKTFVSFLSAAVLVTIVAAVRAQQPVAPVHSTPQPVTAYTPAAPGAIARDSDPIQPQPDAAARTEMGDRLEAASPPVPSAFGQLHQETLQGSQPSGERTIIAGGQPGELGVWLASTGGAGIEVRRITAGSPAEQAGLQTGDIILQVNGQGATSPQAVAQLIRRTPAGQSVTMEIWRDGQQQELQAMLRPIRSQYEAAYRGESATIGGGSSDLGARTMRLEEQLSMVMQELRALRQEMAQLRTTAGSAATSAAPATGALQPAADPGFDNLEQPTAPAATTQPGAAATTAPAAAAAQPDPFTDEALEPAAEPAAEPPAEPAAEPAAEEEDVFGEATEETSTTEPEAGAATADEEPAADAAEAETTETEAPSDDLFE
jgi:hypothetical protein